jgi:hypothetical protein
MLLSSPVKLAYVIIELPNEIIGYDKSYDPLTSSNLHGKVSIDILSLGIPIVDVRIW